MKTASKFYSVFIPLLLNNYMYEFVQTSTRREQTGKRTGHARRGRGWDRRAGAGAFVAPALLGCLGLPGENADSTQLCTREPAELAVSSRLLAWGPSVVERVLGRVHGWG